MHSDRGLPLLQRFSGRLRELELEAKVFNYCPNVNSLHLRHSYIVTSVNFKFPSTYLKTSVVDQVTIIAAFFCWSLLYAFRQRASLLV